MKKLVQFLKKCCPVVHLTMPDGRRGIFVGIKWSF